MSQDAVYKIITERILALLEAGTAPWAKPWSGGPSNAFPVNHTTGKAYRGVNVFLLHACGYTSNRWLTYKQATAMGGTVRKGQKGTPVVFWKIGDRAAKDGTDIADKPAKGQRSFILRYYTVFNVDQCEGILVAPPAPVDTSKPEVLPIDACESIVLAMPKRPTIEHMEARAYYRPSADIVNMPKRETFNGSEEYYSTLFHELTHSTGHKSRLDRKSMADLCAFGDTNYSKEELVAEMGAAFLCGMAGIENRTINNSAAYLASWIKVLKGDPKLIVQASAQAQKAADFILGIKAPSYA